MQQTGLKNKDSVVGETVLPAHWECLFQIFLDPMARGAREMLAEGGKHLATSWAQAPVTAFGMQLMQNGSNFPHCGCGIALELLGARIALELPPRLGDNQCQDGPLQRSCVLISALSLQCSDGSTALPSESCHPGPLSHLFLCVTVGTWTHTAALCVLGGPEQWGGHQEH